MKKIIKKFLYPIRKIITRLLIADDLTLNRMLNPIDLAATYVCAEDIPGDYLEFGIFRGASFIEAYHKIEHALNDWSSVERAYMPYTDKARAKDSLSKIRIKGPIRYFAFDSFEGLPAPKGIDMGHSRFCKGRYDCSEEEFRRILHENRVDDKKVVVVPGYYDKTLIRETKKKHCLECAAIVRVDCDLYESTKLALDFITDLIGDGTIIIFDDWFDFKGNPNFGEQGACRKWLKDNPCISLTPYARWSIAQISFIVNKKY